MPLCAKAKTSVQSEESSMKTHKPLIDGNNMKTKCSVNLSLGCTTIQFKIDTGTDMTVIPESVYRRS